jgi:hypothetical protein
MMEDENGEGDRPPRRFATRPPWRRPSQFDPRWMIE